MPIKAEQLNYIYAQGLPGENVALEDVSFTIEDGEVIGVIGHTGSGKSTLLQHLNGLLRPSSGSVFLDGRCLSDGSVARAEISRDVGLVFQYPEYQLFEETVGRDVAFGPRNLGMEGEALEEAVDQALSLVGLDPQRIKDRSPFELSGGQKRRVAIAGVIAMKPKVLILDEPTAGLDPAARREVLAMIRALHRTEKMILVFVSHNMADIAALSDRVFVMEKGRLVMQGTPAEVFSRRAELKAMGLSVPPVTEIMMELAARTGSVAGVVFDPDEAADRVAKYLREDE